MKVLATLSLLVAVGLAEPPVQKSVDPERDSGYFFFARHQPKELSAISVDAAPYPASGWKPDGPAFDPTRKQQEPISAPQQRYGAPAPQQKYGAPAPQQSYGAPATAPQRFRVQAPFQRQYGAPAAPRRQYGAPAASQQQYGAPAAPQQQYGAPAASQQQYGAPAAPQQQYGAPAAPQQQYGAPAAPQQQYGAPNDGTTEETSTEFDESTTLRGDTESQAESVDSVNELDDVGEVDAEQRESGEYFVALPDGRLQRVRSMSRKDIATMKLIASVTAENVEPLRGPIYAYTPLQKLEFAPAVLQPAAVVNSYEAPQKFTQAEQQPGQRQAFAAVAPANAPVAANDQRFFITF